jgi:hypothetical protein
MDNFWLIPIGIAMIAVGIFVGQIRANIVMRSVKQEVKTEEPCDHSGPAMLREKNILNAETSMLVCSKCGQDIARF